MTNSFTVNTYSPKDVLFVIGGYTFTGWQNITIARNAKSFTPYRGIRGKNTRIRNSDTSAVLTITLLQTSQSNDVLSTILTADEENGTSRIAFTLKDRSGGSVFNSDDAFITGFPVTSFSGQFEYRTWEIFCGSTTTYTVAGNGRPSTNIFDSAVSAVGDLINNIF